MAEVQVFKILDPPSLEVRFLLPGHEVTEAIGRADDFDTVIVGDLEREDAAPADKALALSHLLLLIERENL
jgi:hypothetical protein